jgi:hypothetical protein
MTNAEALAVRDRLQAVVERTVSADEMDVGVHLYRDSVPGFMILLNRPHDGRGTRHEAILPAFLRYIAEFRHLDLDIRCEVLE